MELTVRVSATHEGRRAVDVLVAQAGMSRFLAKKIRLYGELLCNGSPHRMIDPVKAQDVLVARLATQPELSPLVAGQGLDIRYQDRWLLAVSKPAGLLTHPSRHGELAVTSLLSDQPLHPINRLDRDTSGLVLIGLNGHAHHVVTTRPQRKSYLAIVHGSLPAPSGLISAPICRDPQSLIKRRIHPCGAPAKTRWQLLGNNNELGLSLVRFELLTGRTHQIRLHAQVCGCPLVGESLYTAQAPRPIDQLAGRQMLHADRLTFVHPQRLEEMTCSAPLPDDFKAVLKAAHLMRFLTASA